MKALLLTGAKRLEVTDLPQPALGPRDVLVRVHSCGICGSDVHGFDLSTGRRIPPLVMGHEAAGFVAEVGSQVTKWREGDRVTFDSTVSCGDCAFCRSGRVNLCDNRQVLGVSCGDYRRHGAFAEYVAVPENIVYRLPDSLPFEHAALIEAVSVAVHAVKRAPVTPATTTVVVGSGMIGLLVIQALRAAGCGPILAVDIDPAKLRMAERLGADETAAPADAAARAAGMSGGRGADLAIEAVGASAPIQTAIACLRKGGALTFVGNISPSIDLPLQAVVSRELTLYGSCASSGEYPVCIEMMAAGKIRVDEMISARAPLASGPEWFERLYNREPNLMKVILQP